MSIVNAFIERLSTNYNQLGAIQYMGIGSDSQILCKYALRVFNGSINSQYSQDQYLQNLANRISSLFLHGLTVQVVLYMFGSRSLSAFQVSVIETHLSLVWAAFIVDLPIAVRNALVISLWLGCVAFQASKAQSEILGAILLYVGIFKPMFYSMPILITCSRIRDILNIQDGDF